MTLTVTVRFDVSDVVIEAVIWEAITAKGVRPSRVTRRMIVDRVKEVYDTYGGQADAGSADEMGLDVEGDYPEADVYDKIMRVRARLEL